MLVILSNLMVLMMEPSAEQHTLVHNQYGVNFARVMQLTVFPPQTWLPEHTYGLL